MKKLLFIILLIFTLSGVTKMNAQVIIGMDSKPTKGALLDLKQSENATLDPQNRQPDDLVNATNGIMMPRVKLIKFDDTAPLGIPNSDDLARLKATGMIVYNTNGAADGIAEGMVQWSGSEWVTLGGGGTAQGAIAPLDCDAIKIDGVYVENVPLRSNGNTLQLPVDVTRKGSYKILVEALLSDNSGTSNGYVFNASGEFNALGPTVVTLSGQGTPAKASQDVQGGNFDVVDIFYNGQPCNCGTGTVSPSIEVVKTPPVYVMSCASVKTNGAYKIKQQMGSENTITLRVSSETNGGEYYIYTDRINGIKFEGRGSLLKGTQQVILYADGIPEAGGSFDYQIYTNSTSSTATCSATVLVSYPVFKIQVYSSGVGDAFSLYDPNSALAMMVKNPKLFGLTGGSTPDLNAPILVDDITFNGQAASNITSIPAGTNMVFVSYPVQPDANMESALYNFVTMNGGFLVYSIEYEAQLRSIAQKFNSPVTLTSVGNGADMMLLQQGNLLVNGLYQNLEGKYIGRDGGGNYNFTNYEANWEAVTYNSTGARIILHKQYPIVLCGDGGVFSGGTPSFNLSADYHPARVDTSGNPVIDTYGIYNTNGGAYNSALLVNMIMWAIEQTNQ